MEGGLLELRLLAFKHIFWKLVNLHQLFDSFRFCDVKGHVMVVFIVSYLQWKYFSVYDIRRLIHNLPDLLVSVIFKCNKNIDVDEVVCVDIASLQKSGLNRQNVKVSESLQVVPVVTRAWREHWIGCTQQGCECLIASTKGVSAATKE